MSFALTAALAALIITTCGVVALVIASRVYGDDEDDRDD